MTTMLHRRLGSMEKRMGITAAHWTSSATLIWMRCWSGFTSRLAEQGNPGSIAELAAGDDREALVARSVQSGRTVDFVTPSTLCVGPISGLRPSGRKKAPATEARARRAPRQSPRKLDAMFATLRARP